MSKIEDISGVSGVSGVSGAYTSRNDIRNLDNQFKALHNDRKVNNQEEKLKEIQLRQAEEDYNKVQAPMSNKPEDIAKVKQIGDNELQNAYGDTLKTSKSLDEMAIQKNEENVNEQARIAEQNKSKTSPDQNAVNMLGANLK